MKTRKVLILCTIPLLALATWLIAGYLALRPIPEQPAETLIPAADRLSERALGRL